MLNHTTLALEFAKIIGCTRCTKSTDCNLLRDDQENVPQPGYVGSNYFNMHVLLVGQNPSSSNILEAQDRPYTESLRQLRDDPTPVHYRELSDVLGKFIPQWPVHGSYFPLNECGLKLSDIAYLNLVRCRTTSNKSPNVGVTENCSSEHFTHWLQMLSPRVVVFIGKWASNRVGPQVSSLGIPHIYMNRLRSLSTAEREINREQVVSLVKQYRG